MSLLQQTLKPRILFYFILLISIIIIQNTYVYSLNFADDQVLLAQDHDDMEYMARKLKEEYEKWGLAINLEKTKYVCMGERKEILKSDGGEEIKPCI